MNSTLALLVLVGSVSTVTCIGQPGVSLTSNTSFEGTQCPGDVVFSCNGTVLPRLVWSVDGNEVAMFDPDRSPQNLTLSPSLTVELVTVVQDQDNLSVGNFTSTLTADLRALSENKTRNVTCGDFNTMDTATIPPFIVQSPVPQPVYTCDVTPGADATVALNLTWDVQFTLNNAVELYRVRATGGACPPERRLPPNTLYTCEGLTADQEYSFAVTGVNCGSQEGPADNFTITPRVPAAPAVCSSVPVYLYPSGELSRVESNWEAAAGLPQLKPGISQNVTSYSVTSTGRDEVSVMADEACTATGQCTYTAEDFGSSPSPYSLAVSSKNLVGTSEAQPCSPRQISSENNIVVVSLTTGADNTRTVHCEFRQSITTSTACNVCYGTQSPCNITNCDGSQAETGRVTNVTIPAGNTCFVIFATIDGNMIIIEGSTEPSEVLLSWHVALIVLGALCWIAGTAFFTSAIVLLAVVYRSEERTVHNWWKHTAIVAVVVPAISAALLLLSLSLWVAFGVVTATSPESDANIPLRNPLCGAAFAISLLHLVVSVVCLLVVWGIKKRLERKVEERDGRTSESTDERFDDELQLKERIIVQRRHEDQLADRPEPPLTLQGVEITTNIDVRPDAIAGLDKAQKALWEFVSQRAASGGVQEPQTGVLLFGPNGTGKTTLAKHFANESNSAFFSVSCADIVHNWGADTAANIKGLFENAHERKYAVIFLKEVERLRLTNRGSKRDPPRAIITDFLSSEEGLRLQTEGVVIVGATEYPDRLGNRVRDLFKKRIYIPPPEADARKKIILDSLNRDSDISERQMAKLVRNTEGLTGGEIESLVKDAVRSATDRSDSSDQPAVAYRDFQKLNPKKKNLTKYNDFIKKHGGSTQ